MAERKRFRFGVSDAAGVLTVIKTVEAWTPAQAREALEARRIAPERITWLGEVEA